MSSDFVATLSKFAEATAGITLPIEAIDEAGVRRAERRLARAKRAARRRALSAHASGRLVFLSTAGSDHPKPLPHMVVQLWDRDPLGADD